MTLSCGVKISAVCSFISLQSTRVTDRQTDGRTDRRTDIQNYDPQDRASIAASSSKNSTWFLHVCQDATPSSLINVQLVRFHTEYTAARAVPINQSIKQSKHLRPRGESARCHSSTDASGYFLYDDLLPVSLHADRSARANRWIVIVGHWLIRRVIITSSSSWHIRCKMTWERTQMMIVWTSDSRLLDHLMLFHLLTRAAYNYNGCLPWYNVVLTSRVHSSVKYSQQSTVTAGDSCDRRISVLNHCLSWSKFGNTHLSHSSQ